MFAISATQAWRRKFADVAKMFPSLTFAVADEDQNRDLVKEFGFDESSEEINVGLIDEKEKKYAMKPEEEYESQDVISFLKDYLKGICSSKETNSNALRGSFLWMRSITI